MNRFTLTAADKSGMISLFHCDRNEGLPPALTAALFVCADAECGKTLVGNHSVVFNCPSCTTVMKAGATQRLVADDFKDMREVGCCSFCNSKMLSASDGLPAFAENKMYCPVCTDVVAVTLKADDGDDTSDNSDSETTDDKDDKKKTDDNAPASDAEQADMAPDADSSGDDTGDEADDTSESDPSDLPEGEDESDDAESDDAESDDTADDDSDDSDDDDSDDSDDDDSDDDGDGSTTDSDPTKTTTASEDKKTVLTANLLAAVGDKAVHIDLIPTGDRRKWFLMADNVPVAVAEKARCAEGVRPTFDSDKYAAAYHAATKDGADEDTLKEFGFEPIIQEVPVEEAIRQTVEAQVLEKSTAYHLNAKDFAERSSRCLGLASLGMTKGTFGDKNPVMDGLVARLSSLGVQDAGAIVASAFEKHGPALFKTLIVRADDLMEKGDEALTEISNLVDKQTPPTELAAKKGTPPAAMSFIDEKQADKTAAVVTASEGSDSSPYANIFQRRRAARR